MCDNNEKCKYFFINKGSFCALFESCDELKASVGIGALFAKDTCPGII